jgi:hypothetical protein
MRKTISMITIPEVWGVLMMLTALPVLKGAQCPDASLSAYLVPGFECTVGSMEFSHFTESNPETSLLVLPCESVGRGVGFEFDGRKDFVVGYVVTTKSGRISRAGLQASGYDRAVEEFGSGIVLTVTNGNRLQEMAIPRRGSMAVSLTGEGASPGGAVFTLYAATPEPGSLVLVLTGLLALAWAKEGRRAQSCE